MHRTTIISTWIDIPEWADGWPVLHSAHGVLRPSVWLIDTACAHPLLVNRYNDTLSEDELIRAGRFHHAAHAIRYKATHTALRILLGRAINSHSETLNFVDGQHGKPELSMHQKNSIRFNLSYTENRAIIGIAEGAEVGVDIEWIHRPLAIDDMLTTCFSATEIDYITSQKDRIRQRFFTLWTRKEAILKLTAEGIGDHLPFFDVLDGTCVTEKRIIGGEPPDTIHLYSFRIGDDYVGCYAAETPPDRLSGYQL